MKYNRTLLISCIVGMVNLAINFAYSKWLLENANIDSFLLTSLKEYLAIYIVLVSGIVSLIIIALILKEIKNKQNYYMIALSLALNILYAIIYFRQVNMIFLSTFFG